MSGRKTFTAGEMLTAADVNSYLMDQSVMVFAGTAARSSAIPSPSEGMVTYRTDANAVEAYNGSAWAAISGGGKILQIVRSTDATNRTTNSGTFVDASISVTITPTKSDSALLLIWVVGRISASAVSSSILRITDSSDNVVSGAGDVGTTHSATAYYNSMVLIGYATPATTSAVTYKGRYRNDSGQTTTIANASTLSQLYAIEVGA